MGYPGEEKDRPSVGRKHALPGYFRQHIEHLVSKLQGSDQVLQKHALREFAMYLSKYNPNATEDDALFLLEGDSDNRGLLQYCASLDPKQGERLMCYRLFDWLLDSDKNVRTVFGKTDIYTLKDIQFGNNLDERFDVEVIFRILTVLNDENPDLDLREIVDNDAVSQSFEKWTAEQDPLNDPNAIDEDEEKEELPQTWAEAEHILKEKTFDDEVDGDDGSPTNVSTFKMSLKPESDPLGLLGYREAKEIFAQFRKKQKKQKTDRRPTRPSLQRNQSMQATLLFVADEMQQGKISTLDEGFKSNLFLKVMHKDTDYTKLNSGLQCLQDAVRNRTDQMRSLVDQHFDQFIVCKDTIDRVHELLQHEFSSKKHSKFLLLKDRLDDLYKSAYELYAPILEKKKEADRIKSTLHVLKRFQFLFCLPGKMAKNIKDKQFDKVVRDYRKFKAFGVKKDNPLLEQVMSQIREVVKQFRQQLFQRLEDPKGYYDEQEKIIGYLSDLDCETDPAWHYLKHQSELTLKRLDQCSRDHDDRLLSITRSRRSGSTNDDEKHDEKCEDDGPYDLPPLEMRSKMDDLPELERKNGTIISASTSEEQQVDYSKQILVQQLCNVLVDNMPDFWRLSEEIRAGKFAKKKNLGIIEDEKGHVQSGKEKLVLSIKELIVNVQMKFSEYVRATLLPSQEEASDSQSERRRRRHAISEENIGNVPPTMHENVKFILECYHSLNDLKMPKGHLDILKAVADDVTSHFCVQTFRKLLFRISTLSTKERWREHKDIPGLSITPFKFHDMVIKALTSVGDLPITDDESCLTLIAAPFLECLRFFTDCLHTLAFDNPDLAYPYTPPIDRSEPRSKLSIKQIIHDNGRKVLMILSNIYHSKEEMFDALLQNCLQMIPKGYHALIYEEYQEVETILEALEKMVFDAYIRRKVLFLSKICKRSLVMSGMKWDDAPEPEGVRSHILELLLELVFVHQQVYSTTQSEVDVIFEQLLVGLIDNYLDYIKQIDRFSPNGALQLLLEIDFLKETLGGYLIDDSLDTFSQIDFLLQQWIGTYVANGHDKRKKLLESTQKSTAMMFVCFRRNDKM